MLTPAELLAVRRLAESRESGAYWLDPDPSETPVEPQEARDDRDEL